MKTIEGSRIFPYIAWTTFIAFALFTYSLTIQLQQSTNSLEARTVQNVSALGDSQ